MQNFVPSIIVEIARSSVRLGPILTVCIPICHGNLDKQLAKLSASNNALN
jgi:hypothetical protein